MATTRKRIFDLALMKGAGLEGVSDPDENSLRARALREVYDETLLSLLADAVWSFAKKTASLSEDPAAPDHARYTYVYATPSDMVFPWRLNGVENNADTSIVWEQEGEWIVTDENSASLEYVSHVTDEGKFPPKFTSALAMRLALTAGPSLKLGETAIQRLEQVSAMAYSEAKAREALRGSMRKLTRSGLINARQV